MNRRFCLAVDLKDDPELIAEYKHYHQAENAWPEITQSIQEAGILDMEIYIVGNRLFMIMDVNETFSFDHKSMSDASNESVQEWEALMWTYQSPLKWAKQGEKWVLTELMYKLPAREPTFSESDV